MPRFLAEFSQPFASTLSLVLLGCLCACSTLTTAPSDTQLPGTWILDRAASDNAVARISQVIDLAKDKLRKRREHYGLDNGSPDAAGRRGGGQNGPAGEGGSDESFDVPTDPFGGPGQLGPDFEQLRDRLLQALLAPTKLAIDVSADSVRITPDNIPARDYRTGEEFSRFDEYGTAKIDSSWSRAAFVLRARYSGSASRVESYEIMPHSSMLTLTSVLQDPVVGKIQLRSVYHRQ